MKRVRNFKQAGFSLLNLPREVLFIVLILVCSLVFILQLLNVPVNINIPNRVADSSADLYRAVMTLDPSKPVFVQSDWTNSTRGESGAQFTSLVRLLMRRGIKFGFFAIGDPQAPEVAKTEIERVNAERVAAGQPAYKKWSDYIYVGYYSGAEASVQAMSGNLRNSISSKLDDDGSGVKRPIVESPILENVQQVSDLGAYFIITASKTSRIVIERLSGKVPLVASVTGVMGPETFNYYQTGQLSGLSIGLKGAYDVEMMMAYGLNHADANGEVKVSNVKVKDELPGWDGQGMKNLDKGQMYIVPLHGAIILLVLAVILGNIQMILARKRGEQ